MKQNILTINREKTEISVYSQKDRHHLQKDQSIFIITVLSKNQRSFIVIWA